MKLQRTLIIGAGIAVCLCCGLIASYEIPLFVGYYYDTIELRNYMQQLEKEVGTHPPNFTEARAAFPTQVGTYTLDRQSIHRIDNFFNFFVDDEGYSATYNGPEGQVELTIIRTSSTRDAANYITAKIEWRHQYTAGTQLNGVNPGKLYVLYDNLDGCGQTWSSQEWVISIETKSKAVRDAFYEVLPYR